VEVGDDVLGFGNPLDFKITMIWMRGSGTSISKGYDRG
jgi:hypothetical protein